MFGQPERLPENIAVTVLTKWFSPSSLKDGIVVEEQSTGGTCETFRVPVTIIPGQLLI